jgi:hypothetical protein
MDAQIDSENPGENIRRSEGSVSGGGGKVAPRAKNTEKGHLKITFEAGMCMKKKKKQTIFPKSKRHYYPTFGYLVQTGPCFAGFCRNRRLSCHFWRAVE